MKRSGLSAMDLVRQCKVSVSIAYKLAKGEPIGDLNTIYKIYTSLKESGRSVTWKELTGIE
jgi:predicted transcriptional regulator